jgi:hypothetical protein
MEKKVEATTGTNSGSAKPPLAFARRGKPGKSSRRRAHSITLSDLFLWITVVDECFVHPVKAFARAAEIEGIAVGNVTHRVNVLEKHFGKLFQEGNRPRAYRNGVITTRGAALAEIFVIIEQLYLRALSNNGAVGVLELKDSLMPHFPQESWRRHDQFGTARIFRAMKWQQRLKADPKTGKTKGLHEWPSHSTYGRRPSTRTLLLRS